MNKQSGFTVIEVLITIIILTVLLTLGVVGMRTVQINARDSERKSDVEAIARGLESYYTRGNPKIIGWETKGTYPGANEFSHIQGWDWCPNAGFSAKIVSGQCLVSGGYTGEVLPGVSKAIETSPGVAVPDFTSSWFLDDAAIQTRIAAGSYVYKPLTYSSQNCYDDGCPKYILLYKQESTGTVITVKSKHQ